jgi:ArsR family transcriptional regulator
MYRLVDEHLAHIVVDAVTHVEEGGAAVRAEHREEA